VDLACGGSDGGVGHWVVSVPLFSSLWQARPAMNRGQTNPAARLGWQDAVLAAALGLGYLCALLASVKTLGYARDEGFYFQAARSYEDWFALLFQNARVALEPQTVDRYWAANHEHPSFMKALFALSHRYLWHGLHLFREQGTAYRFPGMLVSASALATTFLWGRQAIGRLGGLVAALALACMPQVFYHSHLACFDMPVTALLLLTSYAYFRSLHAGVGWALATGVLYGILLDTKHNSWLLPGAFGLHFLITDGRRALRGLRAGRIAIPSAFYAMATVSPLLFYASWPWLWHDTARRLADYAAFHLGHEYYNMEFLGHTYWQAPMPRLYAWLMTLATVPGITLLLFGLGLADSAWHAREARRSPAARESGDLRSSNDLLWLLCLLLCYAPWLSSKTPIFGGTKHWLTAYPFLCLFAGRGFQLSARKLAELLPTGAWRERALPASFAAVVVAGPLLMTAHSHPWGLSFYAPLVGGVPGAASLGLNRGFWGYTTGSLVDALNQRAARNASVFVHDTALQSWDMLHEDGRVRQDLRGTLSIPSSSLALYHQEQHMQRVEFQIWSEYGTNAPVEIATYDGVPIVWLYQR
jgi:4-amino-4-deoxy-L-arabinose transferase-like glycosyltransferase